MDQAPDRHGAGVMVSAAAHPPICVGEDDDGSPHMLNGSCDCTCPVCCGEFDACICPDCPAETCIDRRLGQ